MRFFWATSALRIRIFSLYKAQEYTVATTDNLTALSRALTDIDAIHQASPFLLSASLTLHLLVVWQLCHSLLVSEKIEDTAKMEVKTHYFSVISLNICYVSISELFCKRNLIYSEMIQFNYNIWRAAHGKDYYLWDVNQPHTCFLYSFLTFLWIAFGTSSNL